MQAQRHFFLAWSTTWVGLSTWAKNIAWLWLNIFSQCQQRWRSIAATNYRISRYANLSAPNKIFKMLTPLQWHTGAIYRNWVEPIKVQNRGLSTYWQPGLQTGMPWLHCQILLNFMLTNGAQWPLCRIKTHNYTLTL